MIEESECIRRVLAGDTEAFRFLVERYEKPVMTMISNLMINRHNCEDVAQDVFLLAFRNLHTFDSGKAKFSTWLLTIARNTSFNAMKKKTPSLGAGLPEKADHQTPVQQAARSEFFERLDQALDALPAGEKSAFVLAEISSLPHEQIAQIESIALGTVRSRLCKAKEKLRALLKQEVQYE
jgi:RNA polymerase sigma-70 factor (ECF subfamily)